MKRNIYYLLVTSLLSVISINVFSQAGAISFHQNVPSGFSQDWYIDVKEAKLVRFTYTSDIDPFGNDMILLEESADGVSYDNLFHLYGYNSGSILTDYKSGKARVRFYSQNGGTKNFDIQYCADNSIEIINDLKVGGNSLILGSSTVKGNTILNGTIRGNQTAGALQVKTDYGYVTIGPVNGTRWAHIYTDLPKFIFNKPIYAMTGEMSSYEEMDLSLQTFGTTRMTILNSNGNVGIGTVIPQTKLHVVNNARLGSVAGNYVALTRTENNVGNNFYVNDFTYRETDGNNWYSASYIRGVSIDASFLDPKTTLRSWIKQNPYNEKIEFGSTGKTYMSIGNKVGVGTILDVNGIVHAREVIVNVDFPADYVFKPIYKLMPLHEVEKYVNTYFHLPEIPSAVEIKKNGLSMGEMQNKLLQKVEELTLYVIQQQKEIEELKKQGGK